MPDIDIDFPDRTKILDLIDHHAAMISNPKTTAKHNTGIYVQHIPHDPFTNIASIEYNEAETRGYQKIDFLNVKIYNGVRDEEHLDKLLNQEPIWELLEHIEVVQQLFHISDHYNLVRRLKPTTVEQLAAVLAIIRPAKRYLAECDNWDDILSEVWIKPSNDAYFFKKSHAISYACAIIVQMNLICEQVSWQYS